MIILKFESVVTGRRELPEIIDKLKHHLKLGVGGAVFHTDSGYVSYSIRDSDAKGGRYNDTTKSYESDPSKNPCEVVRCPFRLGRKEELASDGDSEGT